MKSRGLEALELLGNETVVVKNIKTIFMEGTNDDAYSYLTLTQVKNINQGCYETIEKNLKALEIIKEKRVDLCILTDCDNFNEYNKSLGNLRPVEDRLTYEEFDLLKEVDNDDK